MSAINNDLNNKNNDSKDFPYPSCWQDNERMNLLMAPFRIRSVNPEHYDGKLKFWQDLIATYCTHNGVVQFCIQDLYKIFEQNQRKPSCLDDVIEHMQRSRKIRLISDYQFDPENSWKGWAVNSFIRKPFKSVFDVLSFQEHQPNVFVFIEIINNYCDEIKKKLLEVNEGRLFHFKDFKDLVSMISNITQSSLSLCLLKLQKEQKIGLEYKNNGNEIHIIKIPLKNDTTDVNESDRAMHNLQMTEKSLRNQLENLETEIIQVDGKIHESLKENKRKTAKTFLIKKKLLEKNFESRSNALFNIENLMHRVDDAKNNTEIFDAYKIGSKTLQNILNKSGLQYDNIDEVISNVRDTIEQASEVQDQLSNNDLTIDVLQVGDDDELEQELREIMGDDESINAKSTKNVIDKNDIQIDSTKILKDLKISDKELLDMLGGLDVNDDSLNNTTVDTTKPTNI